MSFSAFPNDIFHLKNEDYVVRQPSSLPHIFIDLENLDHNPQTILELSNSFCEN